MYGHPTTHADPSLIPQLVEESLRYESPVQMLMRVATREVEVGDTRIPEGSMVTMLLASANRDPERWHEPDRFDIDRDTNGHMGLGFGNHFCLGASLARLEGRIALETILARLPEFEIATDHVEPHGSILIRGPKALPLRWTVN